nr:hypothetical protein [Evansella caseinilytica]
MESTVSIKRSGSVIVRIMANHRPVIFPPHPLEMSDMPILALILKMKKPRFSGRQLDIFALMRSVLPDRMVGS